MHTIVLFRIRFYIDAEDQLSSTREYITYDILGEQTVFVVWVCNLPNVVMCGNTYPFFVVDVHLLEYKCRHNESYAHRQRGKDSVTLYSQLTVSTEQYQLAFHHVVSPLYQGRDPTTQLSQ